MRLANRLNAILFAIAVVGLVPTESFSYPWPAANINTQHSIFGTLGEFRPGHLHEGVDTEPGANGNARAVVAGSIAPENVGADCITLGTFRYCHVLPDPAITQHFEETQSPQNPQGTPFPVAVGVVIAQVKANATHLHFEELQGGANPLAGLQPYTDNANPRVNAISVYPDGGANPFPTGVDGFQVIRGLVDIQVNAADAQGQGQGSQTVAPLRVGFRVLRQNDFQQMFPLTYRLQFNSVVGGVAALNRVYGAGSTRSNYNFWATNSQAADQSWDSCSVANGLYLVFGHAEDIIGNAANQSHTVRVDCEPPALLVRDSEGNVIQSGGVTNSQTITAEVDDDVSGPGTGSGPGRLEVFKEGALLASNDQDFASNHTYTSADQGLSVLGNLDEGSYEIKAIDQAGNESTLVSFTIPSPDFSTRTA